MATTVTTSTGPLAPTPSADGERRIKRQHPRRDAILTQAETLIREHRFDNVTLRGLARSMNLSATALYEYFNDKAELLSTLYDRATHRLYHALEHADDPSQRIDERIRRIGHQYYRFGVEEAGLFLFIFDRPREQYGVWTQTDTGTPAQRLQRGRPAFMYTVSVLEAAGAEFRPDFEAVNAAVELWALVYGFVALTLNHQLPSTISHTETLVDRAVTHLVVGWRRPWETAANVGPAAPTT